MSTHSDSWILHHYEDSPYAEKIRLMFGHAGMAWQSVLSPSMPPRPNLDPLTGGYRHPLERRSAGRLALRLGFRQIKGMKQEDAEWISACRGNGYYDIPSLWLRAGLAPAALERLTEADAFGGMGLNRRESF